jgi:ADP-ribose pyrophosphatase YjhB (NUDIX family)
MADEESTAGLVKEILFWFAVPALWLTSRTNRQRLGGARVEAIVVLMRKTPQTVLLVRSVYDKCWMFPQEGVLLKEDLLAAADRGLREECGLELLNTDGKLKPKLHVRDLRYIGSLELPKERWGERAVAGNVGDGPMSQIVLKKKAYWAVFVLLEEPGPIPLPNEVEVDIAKWCTLNEAAELVRSNRPGKQALLMRILRIGMQHLVGARASSNWQTI